MGQVDALGTRIEELTAWLAEDLPEHIETFKRLVPTVYQMLRLRYPKGRFIDPKPIIDSRETSPD